MRSHSFHPFLLVFLGLAMVLSACSGGKSAKFGQKLVTEFSVSPSEVAQFSGARLAEEPSTGTPVQVTPGLTLGSDELDDGRGWVSPSSFDVTTSGGPYVVAMVLDAEALSDGKAGSAWEVEWAFPDGQSRIALLPGPGTSSAKAGKPLALSAGTAPLRFKENHAVRLKISLRQSVNLRIRSARVQVWSGVADVGPWGWFISALPVMVGLVALWLAWRWRRS